MEGHWEETWSDIGRPEGRGGVDDRMLRWDQHVGQIPSAILQKKSHTTFWRTMAAVEDRGHCLQLSLNSVHFLGVHMDLYSPNPLELL